MIKVRNNLFETNSSSTHSLVVSDYDREYNYNLPVDEYGTLEIPFGEFGWEWCIYREPIDKLSYLITDRIESDYEERDAIERLEDEYLINEALNRDTFVEQPAIQEIFKAVKEACPNVKEIKLVKAPGSYSCVGYIDHQSCGISRDFDGPLSDFIFNTGVIIITGNDNSDDVFEDYLYNQNGHNKEELFEETFENYEAN